MVKTVSFEQLLGSYDVEMSHSSNLLTQKDVHKVPGLSLVSFSFYGLTTFITVVGDSAAASIPNARMAASVQHHGTRHLAPHVRDFPICAVSSCVTNGTSVSRVTAVSTDVSACTSPQ